MFRILITPIFARLLRKLGTSHADLEEVYWQAQAILAEDPHNQTRRHHIRKLVNVPKGAGQYRLRVGRWRFRYDIEGRDVVLLYAGLRREDTYD